MMLIEMKVKKKFSPSLNSPMYSQFSLTLMVNHACNLRCTYCYTGAKSNRPMAMEVGFAAIDRALATIQPEGTLELGFFGGEPLFESKRIHEWISHARVQAAAGNLHLVLGLTTNGSQTSPLAWEIMTLKEMELAVSCDGDPSTHDRHRPLVNGGGSSRLVEGTLRRLVSEGRSFRMVTVVRPDTLSALPAGLWYFKDLGVRSVDFSLDLWTRWTVDDVARLESIVDECASLWQNWLPDFGINWFDEKLARMAQVPQLGATARCGFGAGEIAVAPSGNLYPCERLIGEDASENAMRLPGHALRGTDFLPQTVYPTRSAAACDACPIQSVCGTTCRCSNYVRTGNVSAPDGLLCRVDKACYRATARALQNLVLANQLNEKINLCNPNHSTSPSRTRNPAAPLAIG